ncbi:MAG: SDR family oxidoreductase [Planctomycetota bacterium]
MPDRPVALITGGARRVGAATARALAARGCDIRVTYRRSARDAERLAGELRVLGAGVRLDHLDLSDRASVDAYAARLAEEVPRIDVLVHNASVYEPSPLDTLTPDGAVEQWWVNAGAPLVLTGGLAPLLGRSVLPGGGAVVCLGDIHAMGRPRQEFAAYLMSKAGVIEMVRALARDLAPRVRVVGIAPGVVVWPEQGYESDRESQQAYVTRVPLARAGTPEDAAEAIAWLALRAEYITGEVVAVDGGRRLA